MITNSPLLYGCLELETSELPLCLEVLFIGGSFGFNATGCVRATGDSPVSEWNVYVDPEASDDRQRQAVGASRWDDDMYLGFAVW